ncbi:uncharacterized protein LOC104582507 [Brachypodium distachyon]|nr:uncharacterized protein LOC104582507 [Brachypodium distachyon]XP_024315286.1 uncharacterized protein LOC104582507 [Brachypodium distachyon]|eukprot:XP_010230539.2 uncharacterized protein LOC104582507 [Brachypodium distachyon]
MDQWGANREWKQFYNHTSVKYMPTPTDQMTRLLPRESAGMATTWGGTCCVHAYAEAMTAWLRRWYEAVAYQDPDLTYEADCFEVDMATMIHCSAGHGVLTVNGSSLKRVAELASEVGVPLIGEILPYGNPPQSDHRTYCTGTSVTSHNAVPLPFSTPTASEYEAAMRYREHLCSCLEVGPVVIFIRTQRHYWLPRDVYTPYRQLPPSSPNELASVQEEDKQWNHCVVAYGFDCPGGDVRSLVLCYQENAATPMETKRLFIEPDAISFYYVPKLGDLTFHAEPQRESPRTIFTQLKKTVIDTIPNFLP